MINTYATRVKKSVMITDNDCDYALDRFDPECIGQEPFNYKYIYRYSIEAKQEYLSQVQEISI